MSFASVGGTIESAATFEVSEMREKEETWNERHCRHANEKFEKVSRESVPARLGLNYSRHAVEHRRWAIMRTSHIREARDMPRLERWAGRAGRTDG